MKLKNGPLMMRLQHRGRDRVAELGLELEEKFQANSIFTSFLISILPTMNTFATRGEDLGDHP